MDSQEIAQETETDPRPWLRIRELAEAGAWPELRELLEELDEPDRVYAAARLPAELLAAMLEELARGDAASLLGLLPSSQAATAIEEVEPGAMAEILEVLPSDERADLLAQVGSQELSAILAEAGLDTSEATRTLLQYPPDTAGGLMATELFAVDESSTIGDVIREVRGNRHFTDFQIQYIYVVSAEHILRGVLQLRTLVVASPERPISGLMIRDPISVPTSCPMTTLEEIFDRHAFLGVPVVDEQGVLLGVVHRSAVEEASAESAQADHMKSLGIASGEELRSMPVWLRSRRRLSWLSVNIVLNIAAASVIAVYQETLQAAIALAVFLPMISDMSGCSGNQAVAVSLRELSLGVLRPNEFLRVWRKEALLGVINGIALGVLIGVVAAVWQGSGVLGFVVGGALALNTLVAVSIGGTVPLLIRRLGQDPALASGPVLTTVTDMCGFFLALSFATLALDALRV